MPNIISHVYIAGLIKEALSPDLQKLIDANQDAYNLGSMGPDFLFALRQLNDTNKRYCNTMQATKVYEVFSSILAYLKTNKTDTKLAYTLGLIGHYVADLNIHPYVIYMLEEVLAKEYPGNQQSILHSLIESGIDQNLIIEKWGYTNSSFKPSRLLKSKRSTRNSIGELYVDAVNPIFGFTTTKYKISLAFNMSRLFISISTDSSGNKLWFINKLENRFGSKKTITSLMRPPEGYGTTDFMNYNKKEWRIVRNHNEKCNQSVDELLQVVKNSAVNYIDNFIQCLNDDSQLKKEDYKISYDGIDTDII